MFTQFLFIFFIFDSFVVVISLQWITIGGVDGVFECVDIVAGPLLVILVGATLLSQTYNLKEEKRNN